jgi:hypothetical protein
MATIPESLTLREALNKVDGTIEPRQLEIIGELVSKEAHYLRDRYIILKL